MTKSLGSLLSRAEGRLAPLLRLHVHASTQQMSQGDLVPVLHRADKKKRDIVTHLLQVCLPWNNRNGGSREEFSLEASVVRTVSLEI